MNPRITVVVPTHDRPEPLGRCLAALEAQTLNREAYQIIVVDDGGSSDLETVTSRFRNTLRLRLLRQDQSGPGAARNLGVEAAKTNLIAFTDDDCEPQPEWLQHLAARLEDEEGACLVGGSVVNLLPDNPFASGTQMVLDMVYEHYNVDPRDARFFASMNLGAPKADLMACGAFREAFWTAEDRELCDRWRHIGNRLVYEPRARIGHAHHLNLRSFCRQHLGYGRGAAHYHRIRKLRSSGTLREESSFHGVLPGLVLKRLRKLEAGRAMTQVAVLALWQIMNLAGYLGGCLKLSRETSNVGFASVSTRLVSRDRGNPEPTSSVD